MLKVGDTIKCRDADSMIDVMCDLAKHGIETDFLHTGGEEGFVLIVEEVGTDG
jgi:hypothetical protein